MKSQIKTLGELKASGYQYKDIKTELRQNLIQKLQAKQPIFEGIFGFEDTVLPDLERAVLSRHNILLMGLRGQAKTRIARMMVGLLDDSIPVILGSELNEDPLHPISNMSKQMIADLGDDLPVGWISAQERFIEKLATPDVSMADLIGDIDPIKAANNKWSYADERSIHYGLIPRSNRSIFVINELPDLQARIQVSLLNILQEGDIQIRGYKMRLPLDIQFVFTANPEDYTNRGNIITPLKDRIDSHILTHYAESVEIAKQITLQEAQIDHLVKDKVYMSPTIHNVLERISFVARESEYIDEHSGVSARLSISGFENLYSSAERRMLKSGLDKTLVRISDFIGVIPSITGKIELVYEGEQEGSYSVALNLIFHGLKNEFLNQFPDPDKSQKKGDNDTYGQIKNWFASGKTIEVWYDVSDQDYFENLCKIDGLHNLVASRVKNINEAIILMELVLHGLAECNVISRDMLDHKMTFHDSLANMFDDLLSDSSSDN